jgi:Zn-dependent M28 family amino/carboxypeptidase
MGPRIPGSIAHKEIVKWIKSSLTKAGWKTTYQIGGPKGFEFINIIGKRSNSVPQILIAAHYDTRIFADKDQNPNLRANPVPGANDGASGVAVLLELANTIPKTDNIWLVFLDGEDNGGISGWDWISGSRYFVSQLVRKPRKVIILDMVGDRDLNIFIERNSDPRLSQELWTSAENLGYGPFFIDRPKYAIIDDHIPFIENGISAIDIIDFDYPYWHTSKDTLDKVSPKSLFVVGNILLDWIKHQNFLE